MSSGSVQINLRVNYPVILIIVLLIHAFFLTWERLPEFSASDKMAKSSAPQERVPLNIQRIRTAGSRESKTHENVYLSKNDLAVKQISKERYAPIKDSSKNISLKQLSAAAAKVAAQEQPKMQVQRPGSRPELPKTKAITGIGLKGTQMRQFAQNGGMGTPAGGDPMSASLSNTDVSVNLEVPEGVNPDELNKYELMFYGFQRRTAINYINSFYKRLDKFQRENPHLQFPLTDNKQVMTGRLTYDEKGNIKQIKMIRWTNIGKLQDFFVEVVKDMDRLPNPPHALWEKTGEFSIYFSFIVNG